MIHYTGGLAMTATGGPAFCSACAVYDPSANRWDVLPNMPEGPAVGSAATLVVDETISLPRGLPNTHSTNDEEETTATFTSYNVASRRWEVLPDMPAPRDHAGKGRFGETLCVLGGQFCGHLNVVDTVFGYNVNTRHWSTNFTPMPTGRGGCASATIGRVMYTAGGYGDPDTLRL